MLINIIIVLIGLILATYYDLKYKQIPNFVTYPLIIIGGISLLITMGSLSNTGLTQYLLLLIVCLVFIIGYILSEKNIIGGGDIKLLIGILLLTPAKFVSFDFFIHLFFAICISALMYYIIMVLLGKEKLSLTAVIKFAPAILIGYIVTLVTFL